VLVETVDASVESFCELFSFEQNAFEAECAALEEVLRHLQGECLQVEWQSPQRKAQFIIIMYPPLASPFS
jgi:hypothetical protein